VIRRRLAIIDPTYSLQIYYLCHVPLRKRARRLSETFVEINQAFRDLAEVSGERRGHGASRF